MALSLAQRHGPWQRASTISPGADRLQTRSSVLPHVECHNCHVTRQVTLAFADPRVSYPHTLERYALELSQLMTIKDVASHLGIGWDAIKDIQKRDLQRHFARPKLKHLRHLAIDEIRIGKGHHYLTVVLDLDSGAVVFVGDGKGAEALDPFWKRLKASHAKIKASPPT